MLCEKPYMVGVIPCPCQKCFPCRVNRRRIWAHRIDLEAQKHGDSSFVTLTYDDEHIPEGGSLVPKDTQDWLKRLRKVLAPQKIRYFLAGEYGPETFRPHYHAAIFGVDPLTLGGSDGQSGLVHQTWDRGFTYVGSLTPDSAMYVAGYCTKKMTQGGDKRGAGKFPEFSRMSLRPGIGAGACGDIARSLDTLPGLRSITQSGDVPGALQYGRSRILPLGRYLKRVLREELGLLKDTPVEAQKAYAEEMRKLYQDSFKDAENTSKSIGKIIVDMNLQKRRNLYARTAVYGQKETI